jgi:hypothetical protein
MPEVEKETLEVVPACDTEESEITDPADQGTESVTTPLPRVGRHTRGSLRRAQNSQEARDVYVGNRCCSSSRSRSASADAL